MSTVDERMAEVLRAKEKHESELMQKANVVAVGIGLRRPTPHSPAEPVIVVSVTHKVPIQELPAKDVVPRELDNVHVDVQAVGTLRSRSAIGE